MGISSSFPTLRGEAAPCHRLRLPLSGLAFHLPSGGNGAPLLILPTTPPNPSLSLMAPAAGARAPSSRRPGGDSWSDLSKC